MKIYYRISNNSYKKNKLEHATKQHCLSNFISEFRLPENEIILIADNVNDEDLLDFIKKSKVDSIEYTALNNAQSFKYVLNKAIQLEDDELVYFIEDDYLHLPKSFDCINEALEISDYVSLYDHPDKYINHAQGGDNPFIEDNGEVTRVIKTESSHWKLTNSTTMTFASRAKTLKEDVDIWHKHLRGSHPNDFIAFLDLREKGRTLITPVPGRSTHIELNYLTPLIDWSKI